MLAVGKQHGAATVLVQVLAGRFADQAAAFAVLRNEAARFGVDLELEETDVIREAPEVRLAHYFRPAIVARIEAALAGDDTVILLSRSRLTANPAFPSKRSPLRLIGNFATELEPPL